MQASVRDNVAGAASLYNTHIFLARIAKREWPTLLRKQALNRMCYPRMSPTRSELLKISLHLFLFVPMIWEFNGTYSA